MNEKKKLKIILLGLVILINIGVMVVVLSDSKGDTLSKFKDEIESKLLENSSTNEEELVEVVRDNEEIGSDSSNNIENSSNNLDNSNYKNSESSENSSNNLDNSNDKNSESSENSSNNLDNSNDNNSESSENSSNLDNSNDKNSEWTNNGSSNISHNNVYQDTLSQPKKDYLNGMESTAYIKEKLDEKYSENGGIYLMDGSSLAYGLDGSLRTKEGHMIFYWGYFLNDEKPPYNGLHVSNELYRVVTLNSTTREITDFGYRNGRTYEELGFRSSPK